MDSKHSEKSVRKYWHKNDKRWRTREVKVGMSLSLPVMRSVPVCEHVRQVCWVPISFKEKGSLGILSPIVYFFEKSFQQSSVNNLLTTFCCFLSKSRLFHLHPFSIIFWLFSIVFSIFFDYLQIAGRSSWREGVELYRGRHRLFQDILRVSERKKECLQ